MSVRKIAALLTGMFVLAMLALVGPSTNVVPEKNQPVAEAVPVALVYNWRYSNAKILVFSKRNGNGSHQRVAPGHSSSLIKVPTPESIKVRPGCTAIVSATISKKVWQVNLKVLKSQNTLVYNFPKIFVGQRVVVEYNCDL